MWPFENTSQKLTASTAELDIDPSLCLSVIYSHWLSPPSPHWRPLSEWPRLLSQCSTNSCNSMWIKPSSLRCPAVSSMLLAAEKVQCQWHGGLETTLANFLIGIITSLLRKSKNKKYKFKVFLQFMQPESQAATWIGLRPSNFAVNTQPNKILYNLLKKNN